ncbi:MAG: RNA polymerase sigma factor [Cytophagaceae bacterium]
MNEAELIRGCIQGDRKAQNLLYQKYKGLLFAMCCRYSSDKEEAKDIFQESFIKIFSNIQSFEQKGSFDGWLKRITCNTALTYYRKNKKKPEKLDESGDVEDVTENTSWLETIPQEALLHAVSSLPEELRLVFNMVAIEGFSHKEASEMLDIKEETSRTRLLRARKRLIEQLTKEYKKVVQ